MLIYKLLIGLLIVLISSSSYAFGLKDLNQIIHDPKKYLIENPELMKKEISMMLDRRCNKYADSSNRQCENAALDFVHDLDLKPIEIEMEPGKNIKYIVTFTSDLEKLHDEKMALSLLKDLDQEIKNLETQIKLFKFIAPKKIKQLDIGELAFKYYRTTKDVARFYGVLFQDLPETEVQVHYLYNKFGPDEFTTLLHKILGKLGGLAVSPQRYALSMYGKTFYNNKIYHLLVPSYSTALLKVKSYSNETSFLVPFLFNYIYEIGELENPFQAYFMEPDSIIREDDQNDIMSAQVGCMMGIENFNLRTTDQESRNILRYSPKKYIQGVASRVMEDN
jgi:hypothetical protein